MSKVFIDRALLERVQERLDPHRDAVLWGAVCDTFHTAPSGTPAMPVKAYYHESGNLEGVRTRSVGLEVRKEFADSPLVLESDAMARIACLEGEIAKRDARIVELEADNRSKNGSMKAFGEQIAKLQKAVRNSERLVGLRDARIVGLECELSDIDFARRVSLQNEGDLAETLNLLRAELAALKAQEPVAWTDGAGAMYSANLMASLNISTGGLTQLYAAPVSESKAQGVVQWPNADEIMQMAFEEGQPADDASGYYFELEEFDLFIERLMSEVARLNATHVQQVSVPDGFRVMKPTSAVLSAGDRWEIYAPCGSGGIVNEDDVTDWVVRKLLDAMAAAPAAPAAPAADAGHVFYGMDGDHP